MPLAAPLPEKFVATLSHHGRPWLCSRSEGDSLYMENGSIRRSLYARRWIVDPSVRDTTITAAGAAGLRNLFNK